MAGQFITFEGGEGSGKSTQLVRIAARLRARGIEPVITREPGGTPLAEAVRALLLDRQEPLEPVAEAGLIEAARADLFARVIAPALAAGGTVLCDRHADSTLAYQGYGRGLDLELLRSWNAAATRGRAPDITLLFDIDPTHGIQRRAAAGASNRIDREPLDFHRRVREGFLEIARGAPERFVILDASLPADTIESRCWSMIEERLRRPGEPAEKPVI
ncbi:MAG TPA: dTMP kinase [Candidatus Eisenbacteria bacterium]|nr:dTMP kinase [Candidatus Eisenbacteria bacterium]